MHQQNNAALGGRNKQTNKQTKKERKKEKKMERKEATKGEEGKIRKKTVIYELL